MKSKQLFDFEEPTTKVKDVKKKTSDESKKKSNSSNQNEVKVKKKVKENDSNNNNSADTKTSRNRSNSVVSSSNNRNDNKSKADKESTKSAKGICKSNGNLEQKSRKSKKDDLEKQSSKPKDCKKSDRRSKNENTRNGKQHKNITDTIVESPKETKKRSELIEDYKKWNAPDEYLIGKINERTKLPYIQMNCNKKGWTYVDVTDLEWLKEHIGYNGSEVVENKYANIDKK